MVQVQFSFDSIPPNIFGFLCLFFFSFIIHRYCVYRDDDGDEKSSDEEGERSATSDPVTSRSHGNAFPLLRVWDILEIEHRLRHLRKGIIIFSYPAPHPYTHRQTRKQQEQHMLKSGKRRYSMCTCVHLTRGLRAVSTLTKGTDKLLYNNRENRCRREKAKKELLMCRAPSSLRWFYTIDKWRRVRVPPICAKVFVCVTVECNQLSLIHI